MLDLFSVYWLGLIIDKHCNKLDAVGAPSATVKELRIRLWNVYMLCVVLWFSSILACGVGFGPSLLYKEGVDTVGAIVKVIAVMYLACFGPQGRITLIRRKLRDFPADESGIHKLFSVLPHVVGSLILIIVIGGLLFVEYIVYAIFVGPTILLWTTPGVVFMLLCLFPLHAWLMCITTDSKGNALWSEECEVLDADAVTRRGGRLRKSSVLVYVALVVFALGNFPVFDVGSFLRVSSVSRVGFMWAVTIVVVVSVYRITQWASEMVESEGSDLD